MFVLFKRFVLYPENLEKKLLLFNPLNQAIKLNRFWRSQSVKKQSFQGRNANAFGGI
jgi:hypothetical protein